MTAAATTLAYRRRVVAASQARRTRPAITPAPPPTGIVLEYTRRLLALSKTMDAEIYAALRALGIERTDEEGITVERTALARLVKQLTQRLGEIASRRNLVGQLDQIAARTGKYSRDEFRKQLQKAVGISPTADLKLDIFVAAWRRENLGLITSLAEDKVKRVKRVLVEHSGARVETIMAHIEDQTGATASRAALIARTEVVKLNSQITQAQHEAAGITEAVWSTSLDERVRPSHAAMEGKRFAYASPPIVDNEPTLPGRSPNCRCTATPLLPGIDYEDDEKPTTH